VARVLVIEPDPDIRFIVGRTLASAGHDVVETDAISAPPGGVSAGAPPDLVILGFDNDINAPPLVAQARASFPAVPLLALVTSGSAAFQAQLRAAGASRALLMPFDLDALVQEVDQLLAAPP
jgi:DNA-binding response OmpR family regulator